MPQPGPLAAELRATLALAIPMVTAQLALFGQAVIETMLAGHLDGATLAAVSLGVSISFLATILCSGLMLAVPPTVAQLDGAGRRGEVGGVFRQAVLLALAAGAILGSAVFWGGPWLLAAIGTPPALVHDVGLFLHRAALGLPAQALFFACRGTSEGVSQPRPTMVISAVSLIVLLPLGYALIYGAWGLPRGGAAGAGLAGTLVSWAEAAAYLAWLRIGTGYRGTGLGTAGRLRPDRAVLWGLLRIGLPMAFSLLMESALFSFAALTIGRFGAVQTAGHQIALNVAGIAFMVPLGIAAAITVRIGLAVGGGDPAGVRRAALAGLVLVLGAECLSSLAIFAGRWEIAGLYSRDPAVVASAAALLLMAGLFQFADGIQVAANGALRGIKDARVPMALTALAYWGIGAPVGVFLALAQGMGAQGMWGGLIAGLAAAAAMLSARFVLRVRAARPALERVGAIG